MYLINPSICSKCGDCLDECPLGAISEDRNRMLAIDADTCTDCGSCADVCPEDAIRGS